jgi:uncharacterized protein (TIGR03067 family)
VAHLADGFLKARALARWAKVGAVALAVLLALVLLLAILLPRSEPTRAPAPPARLPVAPPGDQQKLQGDWQADAVEMAGKPIPAGAMGFIFAGDKMMMVFGGVRDEPMVYRLDPAQEPKIIDVKLQTGAVWQGIYELKGDSLKLCLNQGAAMGRPTAFRTQPDVPGVCLYTLRRK